MYAIGIGTGSSVVVAAALAYMHSLQHYYAPRRQLYTILLQVNVQHTMRLQDPSYVTPATRRDSRQPSYNQSTYRGGRKKFWSSESESASGLSESADVKLQLAAAPE